MRNPHNRMNGTDAGHRCPLCRLVRADCLCGSIPKIETRTRLILILHQLEDRKPSNTGRLAQRCLPNSEVVIRGNYEHATTIPSWDAVGDPVLLFPHPDARPLEEWRDHARPITLIVPDGTWRQAQRARRRMAGLAAVPCALVSRDQPSNYRLRRTHDSRRLATLEAIAEALCVLEGPAGPAARDQLLRIFDVMVERSMRLRAPVARGDRPPEGPGLAPASGDVDLGIEDPR